MNKRLANQLLLTLAQGGGRVSSGNSGDVYTVTPRDLAAAKEEFRYCEQEWQEAGAVLITGHRVEQALRNAEELQREFNRARTQSRPGVRWRYLALVRLFVLSGIPRFGRAKIISSTAAIIFSLTMLFSPFLFSSFGDALLGALFLTASGTVLVTAAVLLLWPTEAKRQGYQSLQRQRKEQNERVETLRSAVGQAWAEHKALRRHRILYDRLEEARQRCDELAALLASAKYQLIHTDWRSMRGEDFELFLSRIFVMLGYQAQLTKTTGDQGVDLVVTGKGSRIAVQAKGYANSVGNDSVQAVVAGKAFYGCDSCVVITNSRFTSGAMTLAQANGCRLIDGSLILDLIEGRLY